MSALAVQAEPRVSPVERWAAMHAASPAAAAVTLSCAYDANPGEVERLAECLPVGGRALLATLQLERDARDSGDAERIAEAGRVVVSTLKAALSSYARRVAPRVGEVPDNVRVLYPVPPGSLGWEDLHGVDDLTERQVTGSPVTPDLGEADSVPESSPAAADDDVVGRMEQMRAEHGACVLLIDHTGHKTEKTMSAPAVVGQYLTGTDIIGNERAENP